MAKCKYCKKDLNLIELYNAKTRQIAIDKGLAYWRFELVPYGEELQCSCGAWHVVGGK